jgi:glycosyltransferase involved in cell wall biosynthesis
MDIVEINKLGRSKKVSVCIASYNGSKYIAEQLRSILSQLAHHDEVIISDDSSTDNTLSIIGSFNDERIKVFKDQKFRNPIFNFENAIKQADGDVIFLSDQDDVWLDGKVTLMLSALQDYDLVVSNALIGDSDLNIVRDSYFEWRDSRRGIFKNFIKNSYLGCCMAFKRKILDTALPFPRKIPMHDMWLGMVAEIYYKPVFLEEKLLIYRRHENNATFLKEDYTSKESFKAKIMFRLNLLLSIFERIKEKIK